MFIWWRIWNKTLYVPHAWLKFDILGFYKNKKHERFFFIDTPFAKMDAWESVFQFCLDKSGPASKTLDMYVPPAFFKRRDFLFWSSPIEWNKENNFSFQKRAFKCLRTISLSCFLKWMPTEMRRNSEIHIPNFPLLIFIHILQTYTSGEYASLGVLHVKVRAWGRIINTWLSKSTWLKMLTYAEYVTFVYRSASAV